MRGLGVNESSRDLTGVTRALSHYFIDCVLEDSSIITAIFPPLGKIIGDFSHTAYNIRGVLMNVGVRRRRGNLRSGRAM